MGTIRRITKGLKVVAHPIIMSYIPVWVPVGFILPP